MSVQVTVGDKEFFSGISKISYDGPDSDNSLAFKYYDENRVVAGKPMKDHFRCAIAYWHCFCGTGVDPFGSPTRELPWSIHNDPMIVCRSIAFTTATSLPKDETWKNQRSVLGKWSRLPKKSKENQESDSYGEPPTSFPILDI